MSRINKYIQIDDEEETYHDPENHSLEVPSTATIDIFTHDMENPDHTDTKSITHLHAAYSFWKKKMDNTED